MVRRRLRRRGRLLDAAALLVIVGAGVEVAVHNPTLPVSVALQGAAPPSIAGLAGAGPAPPADASSPPQPRVPLPLAASGPGQTLKPAVQIVTSMGMRLTVPILLYHFIRVAQPADRLGVDLSVRPELFAAQMALLHAEGGHPITPGQLISALQGKSALPAHPVVLTFDDGYADFATTAQPVLMRYGFTAVDYVVSGFINRPGYMSADQVRGMEAAGLVVGSHTVHHVNLANVPAAMAHAEISGGKVALEQLLGHPVLDFAYPYGGMNAGVATMVQQAGFRDAVTTKSGTTQMLEGRYLLRRTRMGGAGQGLQDFARAVGLPVPGH